MNKVQEDIQDFVKTFKQSERLNDTTFLITGATGLIGATLVRCLLALDSGIKIICPVRSKEKAVKMYGSGYNNVLFVECELVDFLFSLTKKDKVDYIIHCASPTDGKYFTEHMVETFELAIETTRALLQYAKSSKVKSMVYVSSLEFYGQILNDCLITEQVQGYLDMQDSRSSYPFGKRVAEYLCTSYAREYGVNVKIARLTQTFGAGVSMDDNRVFAQFARSIISGSDIILHTNGESAKPYCYTTDCVSALLTILFKGKNGQAYNVANPDTYISIKDMAELLCNIYNPSIQVKVELKDNMSYAPVTRLRLSSKKLMDLGWKPRYGLKEMYLRLIEYMKEMS